MALDLSAAVAPEYLYVVRMPLQICSIAVLLSSMSRPPAHQLSSSRLEDLMRAYLSIPGLV